jgi:transcriptional regulator with XRE-family HTH domain
MMSLFDRISSSPDRMKNFQRERLEMEITELICRLMEQQGITRADLAERLGKSRPYVTKMLRSGTNLTVKTISDIFFALGRSLRVVDRPLSIGSPRLLDLEIHHEGGQVLPSGNYQFNLPDSRLGPTSVLSDHQITPEAA